MKFIFCTTPIRPVPTSYPPVGVTSLIERMHDAGYDPLFYDIDAFRPDFETVTAYFKKEQPDIVGLSAVVSTAYRYTKQLSHMIHEVSPRTKIILGGNLGASAEILLRKCPIDIVVTGEGDIPLINLIKHYEKFGDFKPRPELHQIKSLVFLDSDNNIKFTGYETAVPANDIRQVNYPLLEKWSKIETFIRPWQEDPYCYMDPRIHQPHRKDHKTAVLLSSKGCTARCTFCHRWDKGYRTYPVDKLVATIKYLKEKHNVGIIKFNDENFGADRIFVKSLIEAIKPLDILFTVIGVRVTTLCKNPTLAAELKDAGCISLICGMETGSPTMLSVMEKQATLEENIKAIKILTENKIFTIVQFVVGMPGENDQTIRESIEFAKIATENLPHVPCERLSVNYFQALPGTAGYEFMRSKGLIGNTLDEEEAYLLRISDVDACTWEHYLNATEVSTERVMMWGPKITREAMVHYLKKRSWPKITENYYLKDGVKDYSRGGYFRIWKPSRFDGTSVWWLYDKFRWIIEPLRFFKLRIRLYGVLKATLLCLGIIPEEDRSKFKLHEIKSLRKIVSFPDTATVSVSQANTIPLRVGR